MRIVEQSYSRLVLQQDERVGLGCLLTLIAPFAIFPIAFIYFILPRQEVLTCDRLPTTTVNCKWESKVVGITDRTREVKNLNQAKVIEEKVETENGNFLDYYRVRLLGDNGAINFTKNRDASKSEAIATQVNTYIKSTDPKPLTISHLILPELYMLAFILAFFTVWYLLLWIILSILTDKQPICQTWVFDKNLKQLAIAKNLKQLAIAQKMLFKQPQEQRYNIVQPSMTFDEKYDSDGWTYYVVRLQANPKQSITLYCASGKKEAERWRSLVSNFWQIS